MKKRTLLSKRNIGIILIIILILGILGGCSNKSKVQLNTNSSKDEETTEIYDREIYARLEYIYFSYTNGEENSPIIKEFDKFLQENFNDSARILYCLKMQDEINHNSWKHIYDIPVTELKKLMQEGKISKEEFDKKDKELYNKYKNSQLELKNLLTEEEKKILKSSKEEIDWLYSLS